ncbi:hypothetical protein RU86_GL001464 [Lactococcus piscium]|uniref:Uncharacterized protein n=1 Tax=Pseudolactococcus piscium TaxID=1364 RepID=A0A2A5S4L4_9LACT|nr:hypothetical protein RU86_GL001464 [Lactococcus piscium]
MKVLVFLDFTLYASLSGESFFKKVLPFRGGQQKVAIEKNNKKCYT